MLYPQYHRQKLSPKFRPFESPIRFPPGSRGQKKSKIFDFSKCLQSVLKVYGGCRKRNLVKFCCVFRSVDAFFVDFLVCGWCEMGRQGWVSGSRGRKKSKIFDFFKMSPKFLKVYGCVVFKIVYIFWANFPERNSSGEKKKTIGQPILKKDC